jgi:outer membrane protein TolC
MKSLSKKSLSLIFILILLTGAVLGTEVLTCQEFIKTAVNHHPRYQISAKEYLIALEANRSARSLEDWNLIASGLFQESTGSSASGFSPTYQKTLGYTVGLEKYIAQTGTAIKLEHSNSRIKADYPDFFDSDGSFFPQSPYYTSSLSLSFSQPLLRNAFGLAVRNGLKISDSTLELAGVKLAEDWEDLITMLRDEYLTWQRCYLNVSVYRDKVKTVEDQLELVKKQLKYGLSEDVDLVQIELKLQAYNILLEQAKMACETQTRRMILLMSEGKDAQKKIIPQEFIKSSAVIQEEEAFSYLAEDSNLKKSADILVSIQETDLETKIDAQKPDLNLMLEAKPNAYTHGFSDSLSHIGDYNQVILSLNASRPLANDKAEAEARAAEEEYKKALKERDDILLNAEIALSGLYTNLKYLSRMVELNEKSLALARRRFALEKNKFSQGRSSVFFILQAEDDVLLAENNLNETVFAREKVINEISSFTDRHLVEYKDLLKL